MKSKSYKLSERDKMNLESIKNLLKKIFMSEEQIQNMIESDHNEYQKIFSLIDHNESGECYGWIESLIQNSN